MIKIIGASEPAFIGNKMKKISGLLISILILAGCGREIPQSLYQIPTLIVREGIESGFDLSVYKRSPETLIQVFSQGELESRMVGDSLYIRPLEAAGALVSLSVTADGLPYTIMVKVKKMIRHTFYYPAQIGDTLIIVMGAFNDWSRTALPLADSDGDGMVERTVYLRPERHEYKFVVNWQEVIDPLNPVFISNNIGGWNSILDLSDQRPQKAGQFMKRTAHGKRLEFGYIPPADGSRPVITEVLIDNTLLTDQEIDPQPDGSLIINTTGWDNGRLRITGVDGAGRVIPENQTIIKNGHFLTVKNEPGDWHFSVLYSLMVDRFLDGDPTNTRKVGAVDLHPLADFHGGDLAGIIAKLKSGYFTDLGINAIWVSPVSCQPDSAFTEWIPPNRKYTGYHGYWPVQPRQVDPRFGTSEELQELIKIAHERDIKVILDFVSNHVHDQHVYNQEHPDWFGSMYLPDGTVNIRNWSEETRLTTWFDEFIPSYNFPSAPEAIDQVVDDALWWLETFNFDGFRQDAVKHVPHTFWKKLTAEMKSRYPGRDFYQIGETFGSDQLIGSYVNPGELNSQFNFAIYFNARGPFSADEADFNHLATILNENPDVFGPVNLMGNITSSHDQVRFMALADGQLTFSDNGTERAFNDPPGPVQNKTSYDKLINFTAFNLSVTGVPVVYYGEEMGLMGAADPGNRRPMRFDSDLTPIEQTTLERISALIKLRRQYSTLSIGDYIPLMVDGPVLVFGKAYFDEFVVVAFNQSNSAVETTVELPFPIGTVSRIGESGGIATNDKQMTLQLVPYANGIYTVTVK